MTACQKCGSPTRVEFHSSGDFIVCTRSDELVEDCPGERRKAERRAPEWNPEGVTSPFARLYTEKEAWEANHSGYGNAVSDIMRDLSALRDKYARAPASADALDAMLGLHDSIEVVYVVDGYEASLTGHDGATTVLHARGDTVVGALRALAASYADSKP